MSHTHTLIITQDPDPGFDADFAIECPGVTDACRMWVECDIPNCVFENSHDSGEVFHGKRHQYIADSWSVPTDTCYLIVADELPDVACRTAQREQLRPGRYEVDHDFDEGKVAWLTTGRQAEQAKADAA